MAMQVKKLKGDLRSTTIHYLDDSATITYRPGELTPVVENEMREAGEDGDATFLAELLSRIVVQWDLEGEDGESYPITPDDLSVLPSAFLLAVLTGVREDMTPKPTNGRGSFRR